MALDGITIANMVYELKEALLGGRIDKIHQPLADEIVFSVRGGVGKNFKVLASANSNHPRMHLTQYGKDNPMTPPLFCMVLRKHIAGGKIVDIYQPDFERILVMDIESANELGDITKKHFILEIMGKHSNLILTDENYKILDSIKRISHDTSSVREVLPGKQYQSPPSQGKMNPLLATEEAFSAVLQQQGGKKLQQAIYQNYTGISPFMAAAVCFEADLDAACACECLDPISAHALFTAFQGIMQKVKDGAFCPTVFYDQKTNRIMEFGVISLRQSALYQCKYYSTVSELLESYYREKDNTLHIRQKSHDIRRMIQSNIERCVKKKEIQIKTRKEIQDKDLWKKYGELITANIYAVEANTTLLRVTDYYSEAMEEIEIPMDPMKTPSENAQYYFAKYNKAKRTLTALSVQEKQNEEELQYLESVLNALDAAKDDADLSEIKNELADAGFIRRPQIKKGAQKPKKAKPMHFISDDGYHIFVGKSNLQNDNLTLRFAESTDLWLHTKEIPGSHVIIRTNGSGEVSDTALQQAALLAAYYSKARQGSMVPVDYTLRKNVKKPSGAKPGMVIYLTNQTIYVTPEEDSVLSIRSADEAN